MENVAFIVIGITAVMVIGVIVMEYLPSQTEAMKPGIMVRVEDSEVSSNKTWFIIAISAPKGIRDVRVLNTTSGECPINDMDYTKRTMKVFGYCDGKIKGDVVILIVTLEDGSELNYNVRL